MSDTGYGDFEFERTFLLDGIPAEAVDDEPALIVQAYFLACDGYALRIRLQAPGERLGEALTRAPGPDVTPVLDAHAGDFDFCALTAKGPYIGGTRYEAERELDVAIGLEMVRRGGARIVKNRYPLWLGDDGWVVDVFAGDNAGLVLAECERGGPVTDLAIPWFCRTEVTDDPRFGNEALAVTPWSRIAEDVSTELELNGPRFLTGFGTNTRLGDRP